MIDFENWLEDLDIQTLTDELKKEIIERVNELCDDEYEKGRTEGIHVAQELIIQTIQKMF
jgi:flagellar biosynthesis/type III secretory pathway protein FliH